MLPWQTSHTFIQGQAHDGHLCTLQRRMYRTPSREEVVVRAVLPSTVSIAPDDTSLSRALATHLKEVGVTVGNTAMADVPLVVPLTDAADEGLLQVGKDAITQAKTKGVSRVIVLSTLGAGTSEMAVPFQVMTSMRPRLLDLTDVEAFLTRSGLPWTIVRPAPVDDEELGNGEEEALVTEDCNNCYGVVSTRTIAKAVVEVLQSERVEGKTLHVVQQGRLLITSPYVRPREGWEGLPFDEFAL